MAHLVYRIDNHACVVLAELTNFVPWRKFVADPNTGNILNFNVGGNVDLAVPTVSASHAKKQCCHWLQSDALDGCPDRRPAHAPSLSGKPRISLPIAELLDPARK